MSVTRTRPGKRQWLDPAARELLAARLEAAVRRARDSKPAHPAETLAAVTVPAPHVDPVAAVVASRRAGEPWFCFEQPDRDGQALAALGCVRAIESAGRDRFQSVAREWRALAA